MKLIKGDGDELRVKQFKLITKAILNEDKEAEAELLLNEKLLRRRSKLQSVSAELSTESNSSYNTR